MRISWNSAKASRQCCSSSISARGPSDSVVRHLTYNYSEGLGFRSQRDPRICPMNLSLGTTSSAISWSDNVTQYMNIQSTLFQQFIISIPYLSPGHPSWRCTAPHMAHCYCFKFGARVDRSHYVWGVSNRVEVIWLCTKTRQNYCAGLWWAELTHGISAFICLLLVAYLYFVLLTHLYLHPCGICCCSVLSIFKCLIVLLHHLSTL